MSPTAPSVTDTRLSVTVRTYLYGPNSREAVSDVRVFVDDALQGQTDATGTAVVRVPANEATTIKVQKDGYSADIPAARAVIQAEGEVWSFWLRKL